MARIEHSHDEPIRAGTDVLQLPSEREALMLHNICYAT